jgi:hypothetical protein
MTPHRRHGRAKRPVVRTDVAEHDSSLKNHNLSLKDLSMAKHRTPLVTFTVSRTPFEQLTRVAVAEPVDQHVCFLRHLNGPPSRPGDAVLDWHVRPINAYVAIQLVSEAEMTITIYL